MMRRALLLTLAVLTLVPHRALTQGNPVGPEFLVNTYTLGSQDEPRVASDTSGNFVIVWMSYEQDGSSWGVFGQRYAASGVPLGPEFRVNSYLTDRQNSAAVASDAGGNFVVVWESFHQDGDSAGVFGQRFAGSGAPLGPEFRVNASTIGYQFYPAISANASGDFVVVWTGGPVPFGNTNVFGQRYAASGSPLGPQFLVNTYITGYQGKPSVAMDSAGNFVIAWRSDDQDGSDLGIFGQRYANSGSALGPEFRVNTFTVGNQSLPSVAADASGNFVVAWTSQDQDGGLSGVFAQRYASSGAPLGPEFRVNSYTTSFQSFQSIAADASGNFVVVWRSGLQDGADSGIFGQRYASSGVALGSEFRVNTYTTDNQSFPAVAADPAGNFVVVWHSYVVTMPSNTRNVFGQRYRPILPVELLHFRIE